jgi:DNA-binding response OmpR family regulator
VAGRFHVLIAEDDPAIVELLVSMLESEYHVSSANTVAEALAFLRTSHVDIVLADNLLPDGRGSEVACVAEDLGSVVIEMSGYPPNQDRLEPTKRLYLGKPFRMQTLLSKMGDALQAN